MALTLAIGTDMKFEPFDILLWYVAEAAMHGWGCGSGDGQMSVCYGNGFRYGANNGEGYGYGYDAYGSGEPGYHSCYGDARYNGYRNLRGAKTF